MDIKKDMVSGIVMNELTRVLILNGTVLGVFVLSASALIFILLPVTGEGPRYVQAVKIIAGLGLLTAIGLFWGHTKYESVSVTCDNQKVCQPSYRKDIHTFCKWHPNEQFCEGKKTF